MIVRSSSSAVLERKVHPYLDDLRSHEIPKYETSEGLISFYLLQRRCVAYFELTIVSFWQSEEALRHFLENDSPGDIARRDHGVIPLESRTYTLVTSGMPAPNGEPGQ